jgi:hypothetical protein
MWKLVSASNKGSPHSLNGNQGRQVWEYDPSAGTEAERAKVEQLRAEFTANRHSQKHSSDELLRLQCADKLARRAHSIPSTPLDDGQERDPERVAQHLRGAMSFYECLQDDDGHFPGDYGGPMFLMPGMLITLYTVGKMDEVLSRQHQQEMLRYLKNHQNEDGGFGLHIEGRSTMFGTALRCGRRAARGEAGAAAGRCLAPTHLAQCKGDRAAARRHGLRCVLLAERRPVAAAARRAGACGGCSFLLGSPRISPALATPPPRPA